MSITFSGGWELNIFKKCVSNYCSRYAMYNLHYPKVGVQTDGKQYTNDGKVIQNPAPLCYVCAAAERMVRRKGTWRQYPVYPMWHTVIRTFAVDAFKWLVVAISASLILKFVEIVF